MAEKVTDYTPKSQNFIDTDLFDVSKHVTQTSGALVIGKRYTILDFNTGDNFTNVANVISGTINTTGCVFDAIGTTPTTYSNGSTLAVYETQSYTYAELKAGLGIGAKVYKALLTQTGTSAPVATVLVNTLSGTPILSYSSVGGYRLTLNNEFPQDKTTMIISQNLGGGNPIEVVWATINYLDISTTVNDVLTYTTIIIEVYP